MKTHKDAGEHRQLSASDSRRFLGLHLHPPVLGSVFHQLEIDRQNDQL